MKMFDANLFSMKRYSLLSPSFLPTLCLLLALSPLLSIFFSLSYSFSPSLTSLLLSYLSFCHICPLTSLLTYLYLLSISVPLTLSHNFSLPHSSHTFSLPLSLSSPLSFLSPSTSQTFYLLASLLTLCISLYLFISLSLFYFLYFPLSHPPRFVSLLFCLSFSLSSLFLSLTLSL